MFRRKSPFGVFFLPPAAFSLPRKEKGAENYPAPAARSGGQSRPPLRSILKANSSGSMWASTPTKSLRSEMPRIPYVKYSTGANIAIRKNHRALRKPDSTVARRAFLDRRCNDNTQNVTTRFSARKRYFASPAPLFCILFSGKTEKSMPAERQLWSRNYNGTAVNTKNIPRLRRGGRTAPARGVPHP